MFITYTTDVYSDSEVSSQGNILPYWSLAVLYNF